MRSQRITAALGVGLGCLALPARASAHAPDFYGGVGVGTLVLTVVFSAAGVIILRRHVDYPELGSATVVTATAIIVLLSAMMAIAIGVATLFLGAP